MVKFLKNFIAGATVIGVLMGALVGSIYGLFSFFYWLADGEIWGLPLFIIASLSLTFGAAFAFDEEKKQ